MGTLVRLVVETGDAERAAVAMEAAFGRLRELDGLLSHYKADSELSRLCQVGEMRVGPDLLYVLEMSQRLAAASGGAFDVTIGDQTRLSTYRDISITSSTRTVKLRRPGMRLDLGGIAKGYAGDQLLQVLREHGCPRALAAVSGDLVMGQGRWHVKLEASNETKTVQNCAVSTSGDTVQRHILDARTGEYVPGIWLVSVLAKTGIDADGLATALRILGEVEGRKLAAKYHAHAWFRRVQ
jgi:thiamine biosynthesis lipoprotein